jgi:hypothetical protein
LNSNLIETTFLYGGQEPKGSSLSFGVDALDELCGGVYKHQFIVLYGTRACQTIVERLCVQSQLSHDAGGFDEPSVFIDGGNTFDVYHVSDYATRLHLNRDDVLRGIEISRAFTCYQLVNLIVEKLPELLQEQRVGLVAISNLLDLFMDSEIDLKETRSTINFLSNFLSKLARENSIALVATCPTIKNDTPLLQFLVSRAQVVLKAEQTARCFTLEKNPAKQWIPRTIACSQTTFFE